MKCERCGEEVEKLTKEIRLIKKELHVVALCDGCLILEEL